VCTLLATESLEAYRVENNGELPNRVVLYRDGVGDGQINFVLDAELPQLQAGIKALYEQCGQPQARLSVVIVTKRINSRILLGRGGPGHLTCENVPPGTVVDNTFTLPER